MRFQSSHVVYMSHRRVHMHRSRSAPETDSARHALVHVAQPSPRKALTDCCAKEAQAVPLATIRSTTPYKELLNALMFRSQEPAGLLRGDGKHPDGLIDSGSTEKWSEPDMGRHSCGPPGNLLHANHISETLRSLGERLSSNFSGDPSETSFLYPRISTLVQIFNLVAFYDSLILSMP